MRNDHCEPRGHDDNTTATAHDSHTGHRTGPGARAQEDLGRHESGHGTAHGDHAGHEEMFRKRFWICLALSVPVLIWSEAVQSWFAYSAPEFHGSGAIVPVVASMIFVYGGLPFLQMAWWELRSGGPGMMTLISLAITVAYGYSMATLVWPTLGEDFFWELATLIVIMLLGHWLEMRSVRQASGALGALAQLMPDVAEVVAADGATSEVAVESLDVGDVVLVRPGSRVPADAVVVDGSTKLDEAMITGESKPVAKSTTDQVIAGTVNVGSGSLRAEVSAVGEDTALAGIMKLVAEAQSSKSSTQLLADRAAALLFYFAVAAAAITAIVWTLISGGFDQQTVARVVTVLVIACPHALGLAIPLVVSITTEIAARNGSLIRNREAIDTARNLEIIAVDKTGTLTEGRIGLVAMVTENGVPDDDALSIVAAAEADSEHLIARALITAADERGLHVRSPDRFEILKGRGVAANVDGQTQFVGGPRLLEHLGVTPSSRLSDFADQAGDRGQSVVYLITDRQVVAAFALADVIRPESRRAVTSLSEMAVEVVMLTGDSEDVARTVSSDLGINRYHAQVLPKDKDQIIADLQADGSMVGMVGDGVNDAPALTRADIGIAIGGGTDVAIQSADLVLVKSNPLDIVRIVKLSDASFRKQLQNLWWGAGYNIVMVPLAAGILAPWGFVMPPALGAALMSLSTVIVAINAQLLRRADLT